MWGGSSELVERLEPRIVLSGFTYAWTGVETLPGFVAEYGIPDKTIGVSDDGEYFWSAAAADRAYDDDEPYLVAEGQVRYLRDIAALVDAEIAGINSRGVVLATDGEGEDLGRVFLYDLNVGTTREYLDEAGLSAPSGFDVADATPRFITDAGGVVLTTNLNRQGRGAQWMVIGPDVTHMWFGLVSDVNSSNWAIGLRGADHPGGSLVLWKPETGRTELAEQGLNYFSYSFDSVDNILNNDGTVLATQLGGGFVLWQDGQSSPLGIEDQLDQQDRERKSYYPTGRSAAGVVGVIEYWDSTEGIYGEDMFVVHPDRSVNLQAAKRWDYEFLAMTESGAILITTKASIFGDVPGGWYDLIDRSQYFASHPEEGATVWMENGETAVLTRSANGQRLRFNISADGTVVYTFGGQMGFDTEPWQREAIADPVTGKTLVLSLYRGDYRAIDPWKPNVAYTYERLYDQIHSGVTGFFDENGWPVIAGLDENADLLMAYGEPRDEYYSVLTTNLSADHLAARGLETPAFVGGLDSLRTSWGARNIVGLDADGQVQAVWWSPGLGSELWTVSNLSALAGAPRLVGSVTATETPWGGIQIHGTDERGHLIGLWWSPKVGEWRVTDLTDKTGGVALEAGSLTVRAGRFGGISTVGKSVDGDVVTYWWSPHNLGGWEVQSLTAEAGGDVPTITSRLSHFVAIDGEQHIIGTTAEGHVIDLYWKPGRADWLWRDLTAMVEL